jgi:hypothetical protein
MQAPQTWRGLLGTIIGDTYEKQRLAQQLQVNAITLVRWINGESDPRPENLQRLVQALPAYTILPELIKKEFPEFISLPPGTEESTQEIPVSLYEQVLKMLGDIADPLQFWAATNLILQQALRQLDPKGLGMAVIVARCQPSPTGDAIHSLREIMGRGTAPWEKDLEDRAVLVGAESLCGYAVTTCQPAIIQDITQVKSLVSAYRAEHEESAAAYPLMRGPRVAGCLLVESTQPGYFLSSSRLLLIRRYAHLLTTLFPPEAFYDPERIQLGIIPPQQEQLPYFKTFRQRVAQVLRDPAGVGQRMKQSDAEELVWQQLEDELLRLSYLSDEGD